MPSEIKPCPFCGCVRVVLVESEEPWSDYVLCMDCKAQGTRDPKGEAVDSWNRASDAVNARETANAQ